MIKTSEAYKAAIVGPQRRILLKAAINIVDPDIQFDPAHASGAAPWSHQEQLHDKTVETGPRYATLEPGRWVLDGSCGLIPDAPAQLAGEVGFVGDVLSGQDGAFSPAAWVEQRFSHVDVLQACSVFFSADPADGVAEDFTVEVRSGGQVIWSKAITGNRAPFVALEGFTVYTPDTIRVTVTKWSLPGRRLRVAEIVPGIYEEWGGDMVASLDIRLLGNFACLAIPYGTCSLTLDNTNRRFEPWIESGVFESIEERQAIPISLGVALPEGGVAWQSVGTYYQASGGWQTGSNDMSLTWSLVDIVGLLANRDFLPPGSLPTTLEGWIACLAAQLGPNFKTRYHVDPNYAAKAATVKDKAAVEGLTCGQILRFVCMATGTWPRADQETGVLTAEPFWAQGVALKPTAMPKWPIKKANDELAALIFKLPDGSSEVISGNSTSSSKVLTVNNPFIHSRAEAITAARQILSQYGGIVMDVVSRGDMSSEIGDVSTVWISDSEAKVGRVMEQSFSMASGILKDCRSRLLQADGSYLYTNRQTFAADGEFLVPDGVTSVRLTLVSGGQGGGMGEDGYAGRGGNMGEYVIAGPGKQGVHGAGGLVWSGVVKVNPGQRVAVCVGRGGAPGSAYGAAGAPGSPTTFGGYSSANGKRYDPNWTDIASGDAYARTGVAAPIPGTGDGGAGGAGGEAGAGYIEQDYKWYENENGEWVPDYNWPTGTHFESTKEPGPGKPGVAGGDGVCVVSWEVS